MKDLITLILAGGDGGRFWPLSDKNTLPFLGKPLAYHHFLQLDKFGFNNIVVVVNKDNELFFRKLALEFPRLKINLVLQILEGGMAGAILSAKKHLKGKSVLIRNGSDIYEDLLISQLVNELKSNPSADGLITGVSQNAYFPGGYLKLEGNKVKGIIEKPNPQKVPSNIVTIVFDYFQNADFLVSAIENINSDADDVFEQGIDLLIKKGLDIRFLQYKGYWGYLKLPWHVLDVSSYYLDRINGQKIKKSFIDRSSVISGDVYIETGVKILENSKIVGPAFIGAGTIIGQNCLVRESMIGANCVIGFASEIARSYIGDFSWFHTNYVGDSIISTNVAMGAGTVCANYKLHEDSVKSFIGGSKLDSGKVKLGSIIGPNVRIGVNSSIMPGIKIGRNSKVAAGIVLDKDLPDNTSAYPSKSNYTLKANTFNISSKTRVAIAKKLKF